MIPQVAYSMMVLSWPCALRACCSRRTTREHCSQISGSGYCMSAYRFHVAQQPIDEAHGERPQQEANHVVLLFSDAINWSCVAIVSTALSGLPRVSRFVLSLSLYSVWEIRKVNPVPTASSPKSPKKFSIFNRLPARAHEAGTRTPLFSLMNPLTVTGVPT